MYRNGIDLLRSEDTVTICDKGDIAGCRIRSQCSLSKLEGTTGGTDGEYLDLVLFVIQDIAAVRTGLDGRSTLLIRFKLDVLNLVPVRWGKCEEYCV